LKVSLSDKKAVGAFLQGESFEGRVLVSTGKELRATWGNKPLVAHWKDGKVIQCVSEDKGVKRALEIMDSLGIKG